MTKIVTFTNQKGGTGKTATVVNTAVALKNLGINVVVIDFDPQGNASKALGFLKGYCSVTSLLNSQMSSLFKMDGLRVIGTDKTLAKYESKMAGNYSVLKSAMCVGSEVDVVLIDTPPTLGFFTLNAIVASDHAIVVSDSKYESMQAIKEVEETIQKANEKLSANCEMTGILFTNFVKSYSFHNWCYNQAKGDYPDLVFNNAIRANISVAEASRFGQDVHTYDPKCNGSLDYKNFAREFMARGWR